MYAVELTAVGKFYYCGASTAVGKPLWKIALWETADINKHECTHCSGEKLLWTIPGQMSLVTFGTDLHSLSAVKFIRVIISLLYADVNQQSCFEKYNIHSHTANQFYLIHMQMLEVLPRVNGRQES